MPDRMPGSFCFDSPPVPPKLDLAGASSQLFQVPQTPSASSSLHRSISTNSRKRPRYDKGKRPRSESHSAAVFSSIPLISAESHLDRDSQAWRREHEIPVEHDYRPNRYRENNVQRPIDASVESIGSTGANGISRKRSRREAMPEDSETGIQIQATASASWSRTVVNAVGKVWNFCWTGAFGGFYAGGGRGYTMRPMSATEEDIFTSQPDQTRPTPIPGQFPEDDIQENWVVVPTKNQDVFVDTTSSSAPVKQVSGKNISPLPARRRQAVMPRRSKRPSTALTPTKPQPLSPRNHQSPSSAETQRHVAQMRRRERREDASYRRLNKQLESMIKEGKAALGTQVEVDDLDMEDK